MRLGRGLALLAAGAFVASAQVYAASGADWLAAQQSADGSIARAADIAIPLQSTAETLRTFSIDVVVLLIGRGAPAVFAAIVFLAIVAFLYVACLPEGEN